MPDLTDEQKQAYYEQRPDEGRRRMFRRVPMIEIGQLPTGERVLIPEGGTQEEITYAWNYQLRNAPPRDLGSFWEGLDQAQKNDSDYGD